MPDINKQLTFFSSYFIPEHITRHDGDATPEDFETTFVYATITLLPDSSRFELDLPLPFGFSKTIEAKRIPAVEIIFNGEALLLVGCDLQRSFETFDELLAWRAKDVHEFVNNRPRNLRLVSGQVVKLRAFFFTKGQKRMAAISFADLD